MKEQLELRIDGDNQNITVLDIEVIARKGEENIIGMNFLEHCLLAIDFYYRDAGFAVYREDGKQYAANWPLNSFRDVNLEDNIDHVEQSHKLLKKTYKWLAEKYENELAAFQ